MTRTCSRPTRPSPTPVSGQLPGACKAGEQRGGRGGADPVWCDSCRPPIAGCLVGLMLAGAFIQQYFNYMGGKLYAQDSFKLKCFLHVVMALAIVSSALQPQPGPPA